MTRITSRLHGMTGFTVVAVGQFFSILGTSMTSFALTFWVWRKAGSVTPLSYLWVASSAPMLLLSPVAGALVDRSHRKLVMMLADMASGVGTIVGLTLLLAGRLEVWHLYPLAGFVGVFQSFQFPAYSAATSLMVSKENYSRASAMVSLAQSAAMILSPILAGALIGVIGVAGIMVIDLATLVLALGALLLVHVPQPATSKAGVGGRGSLLTESLFGFRYVLARPSLLGLQLVFLVGNLLSTLSGTLAAPMILARTDNNALLMGSVQSVAGVGAVVSGLVLSAWGGPRRKVVGVLVGWGGSFLLGETILGLSRGFTGWAIGAFASAVFGALINASNQAIWQRKVPPDVQGRVFAVRLWIAQVTNPIAMLVAGPLADRVLEPGMATGGGLARVFGGLVGTGPGAGMALMFVLAGAAGALAVAVAASIRPIRDVETILPDHDAREAVEAVEAAGTGAQ